MTKLFQHLSALALTILLVGCHEARRVEVQEESKIEGDSVVIPEKSPQLASLSVETAEGATLAKVHLNGRLVWDDEVTVRVFSPVAGRVHELLAQLGQKVSPEDSLATIASADFGQSQAEFRKAATDLELAERAQARARDLFAHGAAAKKDVDGAEADYTRALSENQRAAARLSLYGGNSGVIDQMFRLKAPIGGVVVERNINIGQEVRPDQMLANAPQLFAPLFVLSDPSKLWLMIDVTEMDLSLVSAGQRLKVRSKAFPNQVFEGVVESVGDSLDPLTRTVKVRGVVDNSAKLLKSEMYVNVELNTTSPPGASVPAKAVFLKEEQHYVFVEQAPGQFKRLPVKLGLEQDGKILVLDGIAVGQRVVTEGCLLLQALLESAPKSS